METGKQQREELRRLMREKMAARSAIPSSEMPQISSNQTNDSSNHFMKISSSGKVTCTICPGITIKSWTTHQFSAEHKRHVKAHRTIRTSPATTTNITKVVEKIRPIEKSTAPPKEPPKSILKNPLVKQQQSATNEQEAKQSQENPEKLKTTSMETSLPSEELPLKGIPTSAERSVDEMPEGVTDEMKADVGGVTSTLPEGFFDDPRLDAKARNQEYKDPQDIEWEKYQKALREEENKSEQVYQFIYRINYD